MPPTRKPRQHQFLFSPRDYLRDPVVVAMRHNLEARGAYSTMLLELWDQDEPGVAPDDDAVLGGLAWASTAEWVRVKPLVVRAFDTTSRPGFWVQKRMVIEHARQDDFYRDAARRGRLGGKARNDRHPQAATEPSSTSLLPLLGLTPTPPLPHPYLTPTDSPYSPSSPLESKEEEEAARAREKPARSTRRVTVPDLDIPEAFRQEMADRYSLTRAVVDELAEKILLEFDARGYKNAKSALITWCRREHENPRRVTNNADRDVPYDDGLDRARKILAELEAIDAKILADQEAHDA